MNRGIGVLLLLCFLAYIGGAIGVGIGTDKRLGCRRPGCEIWWQLPEAIFWPFWMPGVITYKVIVL